MHYMRQRRHSDPGPAELLRVPQIGSCAADGCETAARERGFCQAHYARWHRHGDPLAGSLPRSASVEARFWEKVNKHGPVPQYRPELGPCWIWSGSCSRSGHGFFRVGGKLVGAYRFAYELLVGPIPDGYEPDHLCRVPPCVRPIADEHGLAHLEPVTHAVNIQRGFDAKRGR